MARPSGIKEKRGDLMHLPFSRALKWTLDFVALRKRLAQEGWSFSNLRTEMILNEQLDWQRYYLPVDVAGKTVLDVGAGEGESARFYLQHGASKVICVEPCPKAFKYLSFNAQNHKQIEAINEPFHLWHLNLKPDFIKMDIEGYEEALLDTKLECPAIIEVHGLQLAKRFSLAGYHLFSSTPENKMGYGCSKYAVWIPKTCSYEDQLLNEGCL
jgi:SAM-dependent methyltransferase